jgi:ABC-type transporter Mla maintaining outer membrane lipid asymmetry permease subunit MlaE
MRGGVERLGQRTVGFVVELGQIAAFVGWILLALVRPPFRVRRLIAEIYETGVLSLAIICASAVTVGLVLGLQLYYVLVRLSVSCSGCSSTTCWFASAPPRASARSSGSR